MDSCLKNFEVAPNRGLEVQFHTLLKGKPNILKRFEHENSKTGVRVACWEDLC